MIVLYTDGISEADSPGGEQFGVERIEQVLRDGPDDPGEMVATLEQAVRAHENTTRPTDDQTILVLRADG